MPKKTKAQFKTEHQEQAAFVEWCGGRLQDKKGNYIYHGNGKHIYTGFAQKVHEMHFAYAAANGGKRNVITATLLKAEGVKKGVPDWFWPYPRYIQQPTEKQAESGRLITVGSWYDVFYLGLYIEFKKQRLAYGLKQKSWDKVVSDRQKEYIEYLNSVGFKAVVCYGCEEGIKAVEEYLK